MTLSHEVECDKAYVIAGHKGQPEVVKKKGRRGRRRRLKGKGGRGTLEKERPPVFGMIQRGGQVVINLLANVKQKTIEPLMKEAIVSGALVYTDEYNIYARLQTGLDHRVGHLAEIEASEHGSLHTERACNEVATSPSLAIHFSHGMSFGRR